MGTLTRIAYYTRKGIVLGFVGIISFFFLKTMLYWGIRTWQRAHPTPTPAPSVLFGKLPKIKFPTSKYSYPQDFILETIGGELPQASSAAKVFQIPKKLPGLLASRHAQEFANRLGFRDKPISQTPTRYKFKSPETPLKTLDLDIVNYNFSLKYDFLNDPTLFKEREELDPKQVKAEASSFFQGTGVFPPDLQEGESKTSLLRFSGQDLVPATSLSKAEAIRVDFFRAKVENTPLLPPEFNQSPVFIVFFGSPVKEKRVMQAEFNYFEVDWQTAATYPIKTPAKAWEDLKTKKGYIARWQEENGKATIRKVYLAYYDSSEYQSYLQPIFVFEGDQEFAAYVPAVRDEWLE